MANEQLEKRPDDTVHPTNMNTRGNFKVFSYEEDDALLQDVSISLHGAKAITGKSFNSAMQSTRFGNDDEEAQKERDEEHQKSIEFLEKMQLALSAWDNEEIDVGGQRMSRKEAHEALGRVVQNGSKSADWAVAHGYIREDQKDEYIKRAKRLYDLEEEERNLRAKKKAGGLSKEEEARLADIRAEQKDPRYTDIDHGIRHNTAHERSQSIDQKYNSSNDRVAGNDSVSASSNSPEGFSRSARSSVGVAADSNLSTLSSIQDPFASAASGETPESTAPNQVAENAPLQQRQTSAPKV